MQPGRTGVKGVIRDRAEAASLNRTQQAREMEDLRKRMEGIGAGGMTYLEEEREREREKELAEGVVAGERDEERRNVFGQQKEGKFGHLREVNVNGFLAAVEREERGVWVVVHIYEPVRLFLFSF
jgi:hypothetical protein